MYFLRMLMSHNAFLEQIWVFAKTCLLKFWEKKCFCPIQKKIVVLETLSDVLNINKKNSCVNLSLLLAWFSTFQENHNVLNICKTRHFGLNIINLDFWGEGVLKIIFLEILIKNIFEMEIKKNMKIFFPDKKNLKHIFEKNLKKKVGRAKKIKVELTKKLTKYFQILSFENFEIFEILRCEKICWDLRFWDFEKNHIFKFWDFWKFQILLDFQNDGLSSILTRF